MAVASWSLVRRLHLFRLFVYFASLNLFLLPQVSLATLRARVAELEVPAEGLNALQFSVIGGDVRAMHPRYESSLIQVASQFNLLEMVGPGVTPNDGVTGYAGDPTQGPACAIACGAGTIYRNYFAPTNGQVGQTDRNQLDGSAVLHKALCEKMGLPEKSLWKMRNGYLMPSRESLEQIAEYLGKADETTKDELRALLEIGLHWDVEITDGRQDRENPLFLSQAYCSALPVSYAGHSRTGFWDEFATLILESLYESTLLAGVLHSKMPGGSNVVLLTQVGGGAFGNARPWIERAVRRALHTFRNYDLDVRMVCYGGADRWVLDLIGEMHPNPPRSESPSLSAQQTSLLTSDSSEESAPDALRGSMPSLALPGSK